MNTKKIIAFTLAEILTALAIIGVVAAVTLPLLVKNYQKKVFVTRLQRIYSELNNAYKLAQAEYGDPDSLDWSLSESEFFRKYFSSIKVVKRTTLYDNKAKIKYYQISGKEETASLIMSATPSSDVYYLSSGVQLFMMSSRRVNYAPNYKTSSSVKDIFIDINGLAKPNTFGKDVFVVRVLKTGEIIFWQNDDSESIKTRRTIAQLKQDMGQHLACNKRSRGFWCGALIQQSGWKIPDDYPW